MSALRDGWAFIGWGGLSLYEQACVIAGIALCLVAILAGRVLFRGLFRRLPARRPPAKSKAKAKAKRPARTGRGR
jgi:hypothetical protein